MWAVDHSLETSASAQAVWQLWADVERWPAADTVGPEIGSEISGDFPEVLTALAARVEGRA